MKLEIDNVQRVNKFIQVSCINIDTHLVVQIPIEEYREWLKLNDYNGKTEFEDTRFRDFVEEYLSGIINHDSTANLLLKKIAQFVGPGPFMVRYETGVNKNYTLYCSSKYNTYSIVDDTGRPLTHHEIIECYDIFMRSFRALDFSYN